MGDGGEGCKFVGCVQSREFGVRTSPSEVYPAGKLQWHFTCGFDFRHGVWLPFEAALAVLKGLICSGERLSQTLKRFSHEREN